MRLLSASLLAALVSLLLASSAFAGWSKPQPLNSRADGAAGVAVNARGDAAVAWLTKSRLLYVTARRANGRLSTSRVWSRPVGDATVAIDRRGEVTVAWISGGTSSSAGTVRGTYGSTAGRWATPQVIGRGVAEPHLAVSARDEVLLVWIAARTTRSGFHYQAVAWRSRGHRFGSSRFLSRPRPRQLGRGPTDGALPAFDARGIAYLSAACDGVVRVARPGSRRFASPIAVAGGPAAGFSFSVAGPGRGLASWQEGEGCPSDAGGGAFGPALARVLRDGAFGDPLTLRSASGEGLFGTYAVARPDGSAVVTWGSMTSGVTSAQLTSAGALGSTETITDGLVPVAADGAGNLAIDLRVPPPGPVPQVVRVRSAAGGPDQAVGITGVLATAAPSGPGFAVAGTAAGRSRLQLSVWRPEP